LQNDIFFSVHIKECLGPTEKIKKSKTLITDLKEKKIPKILSPENICTYDIDWTDKGEFYSLTYLTKGEK
jgi:hypothetical protein